MTDANPKPCPRCRNAAVLLQIETPSGNKWAVQCPKCYILGSQFLMAQEAVDWWNQLKWTFPPWLEAAAVQEKLIEVAVHVFASMSQRGRADAFSRLEHLYCRHCGDEQPLHGRRCQCWNDD